MSNWAPDDKMSSGVDFNKYGLDLKFAGDGSPDRRRIDRRATNLENRGTVCVKIRFAS